MSSSDSLYLGSPCKRGHLADDGVHTWKRKDNDSCPLCTTIVRKARHDKRPEKYLGGPCGVTEHVADGKTLRWRHGGCVQCTKKDKRTYQKTENGKRKYREYSWKYDGIPTPTYPAPERCEVKGCAFESRLALCADHCHETGKFRGWLCSHHNRALGQIGDTLEAAQALVAYLSK